MGAATCPAEDDPAPVGRPGWVNALGGSSTGTQLAQAASVRIDDPEAHADVGRNASAEDDLTIARPPAHARAVGVRLADPAHIAAVAVHHEQRTDERARRAVRADEGDPLAVARPGRRAPVVRQQLEAAV